MTKREELKQEFEKYFEQKNNEGYLFVSQEMEQIELKDDCEMVCLDFAEPREKRIAELERQVEIMKCCGNCVYRGECDLSGFEECKNFDKWELKR